jgi:hypothetical protein
MAENHFLQDEIDTLLQVINNKLSGGEKAPDAGEIKIQTLFKALENNNSEIIIRAIEVLGRLGDTIASDKIASFLNHEISQIRRVAKSSLALLKDERVIKYLLEDLKCDDKDFKRTTIYNLSNFDTPEVLEAFIKIVINGGYYLNLITERINHINRRKEVKEITSEFYDVYLIATNVTYLSDYEILKSELTKIIDRDGCEHEKFSSIKYPKKGEQQEIIPDIYFELLSQQSGVCGPGSLLFSDYPRIEKIRINKKACPVKITYQYSYEYVAGDYSGGNPPSRNEEYSVSYI